MAPQINFCFQGWVRGAVVREAANQHGEKVDVSKMSAKALVQKLKKGQLFVSLSDLLCEGVKEEIELSDFEENK